MLKIEKNIPIPAKKQTRGRSLSEESKLLISMKVGDSVFIDNKKMLYRCKKIMQVRDMATTHRKVSGGWRVWRIHKASANKGGFGTARNGGSAL